MVRRVCEGEHSQSHGFVLTGTTAIFPIFPTRAEHVFPGTLPSTLSSKSIYLRMDGMFLLAEVVFTCLCFRFLHETGVDRRHAAWHEWRYDIRKAGSGLDRRKLKASSWMLH